MGVQEKLEIDNHKPVTVCKIVNINDSRRNRKKRIEAWLEQEMSERYGDDDFTLKNSMLRISTKFDALSTESQRELYGYAKGCILGMGRELCLRDQFWSILQKGGSEDGSWGDIEEFADTLLEKEKTYKRMARAIM